MKSPLAYLACRSRLMCVVVNLWALARWSAHRALYWGGIKREIRRRPPSRLGILLAANMDLRKKPVNITK